MASLLEPVYSLVVSLVMLLVTLSIIPFMCKLFVPVVGESIWRGYCRLLAWSFRTTVQLIRYGFAKIRGR